MSDIRYPVGKFSRPEAVTREDLDGWINELDRLPENLRQAAQTLSEQQLDTPYRPAGWTVRQVVHHLADSHMNSYARFRLALTEDEPIIKPYDEAAWANLGDAKAAPIASSLDLLSAMHSRWVLLLRSLSEEQWRRTFRHPEN